MPKRTEENFLDKQFDIQKLMKGSDSYKSLIYGIVTVVVLFVVIALGLRSLSQNKAQIDEEAVMTENAKNTSVDNRYTVQEGETLWSIAQKSYNNGFAWGEIAKANNITNPETLEKGTKLVIPKLAQTPKVIATTQTMPAAPPMGHAVMGKITASSYTVTHGDYLWEIAVRAYGDGYKWVDIARANNLTNPDVIHSGNVLKLPRV